MSVTLHVPSLIPPRDWASAWNALDIPTLKTMLARARYKRSAPLDEAALTGELLGMAGCSIAPLLARADGLDTDNGYWLCVTPVHLETHHHALVLADPARLSLNEGQSAALAATLAAHLREEGYTLHAPHPARWYLRCDQPPLITTSALNNIIGHDVHAFLPQGADALAWHRRLTELQMLLHTHSVNDAREATGQAPVNSVWLWGGGTLPARFQTPFQSVWSDDALTRAIARHAGIAVHAHAPQLAAIGLDNTRGEPHFFSYHELASFMRRGELAAWGAAVTALDRDWFQTLNAALKARSINGVSLISANHEATHRFQFGNWDFLKIFNKIKYL